MASSHGSKTDLSSFLKATKYDQSSLPITCFKQPRDGSYADLTRLSVYRNPQTQQDEPHDHSHTANKGSKNRNEYIDGCHDEVNDKIEKALSLITLGNKRNLIQFWSPSRVGKHRLLKTVDQPFGLGIHDDGLFHYRKESERNWFYVDEKCEEEDLVPVVRVFRRWLPEWTSDIANYKLKNHPLKDYAIHCNLHGYLVLPVFDSATKLCVGVLECITSSEYLDCAYEVQEIHRTLKAANLTSPQAFGSGNHKKWSSAISNRVGIPMDDATSRKMDMVIKEKGYNSGEEGASTKQGKSNCLILEEKYYEKWVGEVSMNLGSQETTDQTGCINAEDQCDLSSHNNWNIVVTNTHETYVDDHVKGKKIDGVTKGEKYNCGEERGRTKRNRKRKMDSVTLESIQKYFGMPIEEASRRFGVSRSTLKRVCRKLNIPSWPMPNRSKKYAHFSIFAVVFLLVKLKRWSCSSNRHGVSGRWWICGRHNTFVSKSNPSAIPSQGMTMCRLQQPLKESNTNTPTPLLEPPQACLGIQQALPEFSISDSRMVTVKATFKDDIIKFQSPLSSRLSELKNQVAQRFKIKNTKFHLKYMDEDNDMILIACDADLRNLMSFSATRVSKNTIKLIVQMAD